MKPKDITDHPLLDSDQQKMARIMSRLSKTKHEEFELIDFAKVALRATGRDYAETSTDDDASLRKAVAADIALQRAAVLFTYEALKACDIEIIKQWPEFGEMLRCLETLHQWLPL